MNKIGGSIGAILANSGTDNDMYSVRFNNYMPGASILSISSDAGTAKERAANVLMTIIGGKSTFCIVESGSFLNYSGSNPFNTMIKEAADRMEARFELQSILINQYPTVLSGLVFLPTSGEAFKRLNDPFLQLLLNKEYIHTASSEFGVPAEVIGSIILKELFTQSLTDEHSILVNSVVPGRSIENATVGLGAVSIQGARRAWPWYADEFTKEAPSFLDSDFWLLYNLTYNNEFNIRTVAVLQLNNGANQNVKLDPYSVTNWTSADWRNVLYEYNNVKGYDYADKVMEYFEPMKVFLA